MAAMKGKRVLITGAGAGIGACLAAEMARAKARLLLVDLRPEALAEQAAKLRALGAEVETYVLDVSKREEIAGLYEFAKKTYGGVDVLVNNAGIGHSGELAETSLETWQRLMNVNFWGPLYLSYAFLPDWLADGRGHLVNVSSGQAFFRLPTWGPYSVIKLALGAFSELLGTELRGRGITVTTVYPFMVNTGFYNGIKGESFGAKLSMKLLPYYSMTPERVGRILFLAIEKSKTVEMVSPLNGLGVVMRGVPPLARLVGDAAYLFLGKKNERRRSPAAGDDAKGCSSALCSGRFGFTLDETMSGTQVFEPGQGPSGAQPFEFTVAWGPASIREWGDPRREDFLIQPLKGTVTAVGLCEKAPCEGTLALRYFSNHTIRYEFTFEANGEPYRYVGEKVNIKPWNLPVSHTTCFGTLTKRDSGVLVARSVTHFRLGTALNFLGSFRPKC